MFFFFYKKKKTPIKPAVGITTMERKKKKWQGTKNKYEHKKTACVSTQMHTYMDIRTYIHIYIYTYIHTYIHALAYIKTSMHQCIHAYKFINACACLHAYTQRKMHAHLDVILCIARGLFESRPRWFPWKTQTVNVRAVLRVIIGQGKFSIGSRLLHNRNE
jgi:hypothetical protein